MSSMYAEGKSTTPSVVLFDEDDPTVGEEAKKLSTLEPNNTEQFVKRHMGERDYFFTNENGSKYTPETVSALILKKLKQDAEKFLGEEVDGAVVTTPAYFTDAQRKATMDAGEIAGLNILEIINEPTAAALSYGISKSSSQTQNIMVYDLGGGTFDVTVMRFDKDTIEIKGTYGDKKLGGYDFDQRIIRSVMKEAQSRGLDIEKDPRSFQDLTLQAEQAKITLSAKNKTNIILNIGGTPMKYSLTRGDFEEMIDPLLNRTIASLDIAMDSAEMEYSDLDKIILVGGSTRIPYVSSIIKDVTGIEPSGEVNPDEAVAIGAAYYICDVLRRAVDNKDTNNPQIPQVDIKGIPSDFKSYSFTDVTSHGIGVVCIGESGEDENSVIVPRNTQVPIEVSNEYSTVMPFQDSLEIKITQGDEVDLRYVQIVGQTTIPIMPRKELVGIRVTIICDENSLIHVRVFDMGLKKDLGEMSIDRVSNLTKEEIDAAKKQISAFDISGD